MKIAAKKVRVQRTILTTDGGISHYEQVSGLVLADGRRVIDGYLLAQDAPLRRQHASEGVVSDEWEQVEVDGPTMMVLGCDWSRLSSIAVRLDVVRRLSTRRLGYDGVSDCFGGCWEHSGIRPTLAGCVQALTAFGRVLTEAWLLVHRAHGQGTPLGDVRRACEAITLCHEACALLAETGIVSRRHPHVARRPGWGIAGLRWLAGDRTDDGVTDGDVLRFVRDGTLPTRTGDTSAAHGWSA